MNLSKRISLMTSLREDIELNKDYWAAKIREAEMMNPWFTPSSTSNALKSISAEMLDPVKLEKWVGFYPVPKSPANVGIIMAGNLPLVGFADWLAVFMSGHRAMVKCSDKDSVLFPAILERLKEWEPEFSGNTIIEERLKGYDAIIATGSNNTSLYFKSYFKHVPHIIRKNRTSVGVIQSGDDEEVLEAFNADIHSYFGLGCRNVSKLYLPLGFDIRLLMSVFERESSNIAFNKYKNNFDYNLSIYLLNKIPFYTDNNIILIEDKSPFSRIACLHYEWYDDVNEVMTDIKSRRDDIQCIVSSDRVGDLKVIPPGTTQSPGLFDYADDVDTMHFLSNI